MDAWIGRKKDPITLHNYLYANVNPANMVDPTGYFSGSISGQMAAVSGLGVISAISLATSKFGFDADKKIDFGEIRPVDVGWLTIITMGAPPSLAKLILKKEIDVAAANTAGKNRALADVSVSKRRFGTKRALIGETQSRVDAAAEYYEAITIGFDSPYNYPGNLTGDQVTLSMAYNFGWILSLRSQDFDILDIGLDKKRNNPVSKWYLTELTALKGYYKHQRVSWP
jgi:hypothetical protein